MSIRVLVVTAIPQGAPRVGDGEIQKVTTALGERAGMFKFVDCPAGTLEAVYDALQDVQPHIVHLVGHGNEEEIILEDESGEPFRLLPQHLSGLIRKHASVIGIYANICWGAKALSPMLKGVTEGGLVFILGNQVEEYDQVARQTARAFYVAIAKGRTLKDAADLASVYADAHRNNLDDTAKDGGFKLLTRGGVRADKMNLAKEAARVDEEIALSKIPLVLFHHAMDDLTMIEKMLPHFSGRPLRYERVTEHTPATKIASLWDQAALVIRCMSTNYATMDMPHDEVLPEKELVLMLKACMEDPRFDGLDVWPEDRTPAANAYVESETDHDRYGSEGLDDRRQNATEEALFNAAVEIMRRVGAIS